MQSDAEHQGRVKVREFLNSLSGWFLLRTVLIGFICGLVYFLTSVAAFQRDHVTRALELVDLIDAHFDTETRHLGDWLASELTEAGVEDAFRTKFVEDESGASASVRLRLPNVGPPDYSGAGMVLTVDAVSYFTMMKVNLLVLVDRGLGYVRVREEIAGSGSVEFAFGAHTLRSNIANHLAQVSGFAIVITGIVSTINFLLIEIYVSRPVGRIIKTITRFQQNPGRVDRTFVPSSSISDLRRAEEVVHSMQSRHGRLIQTGDNTNRIGHDLKNFLQTLSLRLQLMQNAIKPLRQNGSRADPKPGTGNTDEMAYNLLEKIQDSLERANDFVNRFLDFNNADQFTGQTETLLVRSLVKEVFEDADLLVKIGQRNITLRNSVDTEMTISADRVLLFSALLNLVRNAIAAINVSVDQDAAHSNLIEIWAEQSPGQTALFIRDDGPGISPSRRQKIFEFSPKIKPGKSGGFGIGLHDAYRRIADHGGELELVESRTAAELDENCTGTGTTFEIVLPFKRPVGEADDGLSRNG